jgi:iron complex transport system substrate-binding protein
VVGSSVDTFRPFTEEGMRMHRRLLAVFAVAALVLAACGGDAGTTTTEAEATTTTEAQTTTTEAPTTTTTEATTTTSGPAEVVFTGADGVETTITDTSRIVSLTGDITEVIYELGLGDHIVAVDVTTTYPPEATDLPVVGFGQQLAPEPVLAFEPTLVIGDEMTAPEEAIQQLRDAGVPVVILPTQSTLEGVSVKIRQIAEILSAQDAGEELVARVESDIATAKEMADSVDADPRVAFIYVRGPQLLLLFGQGMATNAMITGAGAIDAGADSGVFGAVPLTPEALVAAAPDVIVLPESGLEALGGPEAFAEIPGVAETPAGENGAFLSYDEAYFFNLGPRAGLALQDFVVDLYPELGGS